MKLEYVRKGDYLYPNLIIESTENRPIGKYGLLRKSYLKKHKPDWYSVVKEQRRFAPSLVPTEKPESYTRFGKIFLRKRKSPLRN